jgi:hypothetical protein
MLGAGARSRCAGPRSDGNSSGWPPAWLSQSAPSIFRQLTRPRAEAPVPSLVQSAAPGVAATIVAPHEGQVALVPINGASPRSLTAYRNPIRALDVTAIGRSSAAIASVLMPPPEALARSPVSSSRWISRVAPPAAFGDAL